MPILNDICLARISKNADTLEADIDDGCSVELPRQWFPRRFRATQAQRDHDELLGRGFGAHWPDVEFIKQQRKPETTLV